MGLQRQRPGTLPQARALVLSTATTVTVVAWGVLVFAAIDFGRDARTGQSRDWVFLALATLGAVACMFLAIVLAARMQNMIRLSARTSTRPLPRALQEPEPDGVLPERPLLEPSTEPSTEAPVSPASRGRRAGGKRAVRR